MKMWTFHIACVTVWTITSWGEGGRERERESLLLKKKEKKNGICVLLMVCAWVQPLQRGCQSWRSQAGRREAPWWGWTRCWPWKCRATAGDGSPCPVPSACLTPLAVTSCTLHSPYTHDLFTHTFHQQRFCISHPPQVSNVSLQSMQPPKKTTTTKPFHIHRMH